MSAPAFVPADRDLRRVARDLHSKFLALQCEARVAGHPIFATEGERTRDRQEYLYALGRTLPGAIVTHAKPGQSKHESGCAIDFAFEKPKGGDIWDGPWDLIGAMAEKQGLVWGGRFSHPDRPHLELPPEA